MLSSFLLLFPSAAFTFKCFFLEALKPFLWVVSSLSLLTFIASSELPSASPPGWAGLSELVSSGRLPCFCNCHLRQGGPLLSSGLPSWLGAQCFPGPNQYSAAKQTTHQCESTCTQSIKVFLFIGRDNGPDFLY